MIVQLQLSLADCCVLTECCNNPAAYTIFAPVSTFVRVGPLKNRTLENSELASRQNFVICCFSASKGGVPCFWSIFFQPPILLPVIPTRLQPYLPPILLPILPTRLPPRLPPILLPILPTGLPPRLPPSLLPSLLTRLQPSLPPRLPPILLPILPTRLMF